MEFEEPLQAFLRKIESLGPNFELQVKDIERSREALTAASSKAKKWEKAVKEELVKSINEIDKKISSYEYIKSKERVEIELQKVTQQCLDKLVSSYEYIKSKERVEIELQKVTQQRLDQPVKEQMQEHYSIEEEPKEEDNTDRLESWVATALKDVEKKFVTDPDLRYKNLELILQRCLLSLFVFPYEQVIKKRSIIYLWIGESLVKPTRDRTAEQVGEGYFKMLLMSGLVLPIKKEHDKTARGCMLRQNVWQMLKSRAEESGLFKYYSEGDLTKRSGNIECPVTCFRGTKCEVQHVVTCLEQKTNEVLTLFNSSVQYLNCTRSKFSRLKSIKVLQLGKWQSLVQHTIEMADDKYSSLDSLQVMQKLAYLGLEGVSGITSLDLKNHTSLRILNLRACHHLEKLPSGITLLTKLTHLDVSECPLIDSMPKGLPKLSELQVLKGFIICRHQFTDSCRLQELAGLKKLRKLSINIARHVEANAHLKELNNFTSLRSLTITWGQGPEKPEPLSWYSETIEKLDIRRIPHFNTLANLSPRQFPNLKKLYIFGGKVAKLNLHIRRDWKVETLRLKFLSNLEWDKWSELVETFPRLAFVEIRECLKLNKKFARHLREDGLWKKGIN